MGPLRWFCIIRIPVRYLNFSDLHTGTVPLDRGRQVADIRLSFPASWIRIRINNSDPYPVRPLVCIENYLQS